MQGEQSHAFHQHFRYAQVADFLAFRFDEYRLGGVEVAQRLPNAAFKSFLRRLRFARQVPQHRAAMRSQQLQIEHLGAVRRERL